MGVVLADAASAGKLVGNLDSANSTVITIGDFTANTVDRVGVGAQGFTTGSDPKGYVITGVDIPVRDGSTSRTALVSIHHSTSSAIPVPGSKLYDLTGSVASAGVQSFTASANAVLNGSTTYFLRVAASGAGNGRFTVYITESDDEDLDSASGWSVADTREYSNNGGSSWLSSAVDTSMQLAVYGSPLTNSEAEGRPEITGDPLVGKLLIAHTSGISDPNGLSGVRFRYQWVRVDGGVETDVSGATKSAYTLASDDVGRRLKVRVSFTDDAGFSERTVSSAVYVWPRPADTVEFVSNLNQRLPNSTTGLSVSVPQGQRFTTGNATGSVYVIDKVVVDVTNPPASGFPEAAIYTSVSNLPGVKLFDLTGSGSPGGKRAFTAPANAVLNPSTNYFFTVDEADALGDFRVQTTPSTDEDSGVASGWSIAWFRVYKDPNGWHRASSLNKIKIAVHGEVSEVRPSPNSAASGKPEITGTARIGEVLTVEFLGISDGNGLSNVSFVYHWLRVDDDGVETDIPGATNSSYTVTSDDLDKSLKVSISFVDDDGYYEALVSEALHVRSVLVSNINQQSSVIGGSINDNNFFAQQFTTGNHSAGYNLSKVLIKIITASSTRVPVIGIYTSTGNNRPGTKLYELTGSVSETGDRVFTAPAGAILEPDTKYFVHVAGGSGSSFFRIGVSTTTQNIYLINLSSLPGWSISIFKLISLDGSQSWASSNGYLMLFSILGASRIVSDKPVIAGSEEVGETLVADVSGIEMVLNASNFSYQWIRVDGGTETNISGATNSSYTVGFDDVGKRLKVSVYFTDDEGNPEGPLTSDATEEVERVHSAPWGVWSDGQIMWVADDDDDKVYAYDAYPNVLNSDQTFDLASGNDDPRGVWSDGVTMWVADKGSGTTDYVYAYKMSDKSRDSGKDFSMSDSSQVYFPRGLWSDGVTMWVAKRRHGLIYGQVHAYRMSDRTSDSGKNFNLKSGHDNPGGMWSDGVIMWVVDQDTDDVVAYDLSSKSPDSSLDIDLSLENADPRGVWSDGVSFWVADSADDRVYSYVFADLAAGFVPFAPDAPTLNFAQANSLYVLWSEPRNYGPVIDDYDVQYRQGTTGSFTNRSHTGTSRSTTITGLTAGTSYQVRVRASNAEGTSVWSQTASFTVGYTNADPVFSSNSGFSVNENNRNVGVVVASDGDSQDSVTGYTVSGGADRSRFSITDGGVLSFKSAPNFESPVDSGGDNVYNLEVTVDSGSDGRERFASMNFSVEVADVLESPFAPGAPGLTPLNATSLFVSWDEPDNVGPAITGYDVEYSLDGVSFSDWDHNGTSRRARITGLSAGTLYYVRVRAVNDEGSGSWSGSSVVVTDLANAGLPVSSGVLVSNLNKPKASDGWTIHGTSFVAQEFTTGSYSNGYTVSKIVVNIFAASSTRVPVVSIYSSEGGRSGVKLYDFSGSVNETGLRNFTVPVGVTLSPDTSYFFRVSGGSGSGSFKVHRGQGNPGNSIDSNSASGWGMPRDKFSSSNTPTPGFRPIFSVRGAERSGSVPDVNRLPAFSSSSTFTVQENTVSVGTVTASDPDSEDGVTGYGVSGGVDSALFEITNAGVLSFRSAPDFESPSDSDMDNDYVVEVEATSGEGDRVRTATQVITVTVGNVNEAPEFDFASININLNENVNGNSNPERIIFFTTATDSDGDNLTYSITLGDTSKFRINESNGDVYYIGRGEDYESFPANLLFHYALTITVSDGSLTDSYNAHIEVLNVNDAPQFNQTSYTFSLSENRDGSTTPISLGFVNATDADNNVLTYRIISGNADNKFNINETTGEITYIGNGEDYEDTTTYQPIANVYDGTISNSILVTINILDVNEPPSTPSAPVLSSPSSTSLRVVWSAPSNTGPVITDYDVQYRVGSSGSFSNQSHTGNGTSTTITGLSANTLYEVRVRASNAEGTSGWSQTSSFTTGSSAPPPVTNNAPVFTSISSFSVNENSRSVGTVVASDGDSQDSVTGYSISGGDSSRFSITNAGVLTFNSVPNYESPVDVGGNNVYNIVVRATSGTGTRVRTGTQAITVSVDDVAEAPSAPSAPVLSSPSSTSLRVTWSAPSNTGPAIDDYDVQYRQGTTGSFSSRSHSGTSRSTTITGLTVSTQYQVRVRASNAEGTSSWSQTASFTVGDTNADPVFTSNSGFSVNENNRSVGTVVASDGDSQDSVTGYGIWGGVDRSRFSITDGGVLTFDSVPDFESPVDYGGNNVYNLVVRVTSGTGSRSRGAFQSITVTVDDVDEAPSAPSAPVLSSPSSSSLRVTWSAPSNTGPPVNDYDVQYRQGTTGSFSSRSHLGNSTSTTIAGLSASTLYEVRVRAGNVEGTSVWSQTASFTTSSPPQVTNNLPGFTSSSSFSVNENVRSVGTVVASDSDAQDSVTGYAVSGGVDSARFSITGGGVLTFDSVPNFESPVDVGGNNVYNLVVRVTSGTGGRFRIATQSITVRVDDVAEAPSTPSASYFELVYFHEFVCWLVCSFEYWSCDYGL